VFERTRRFIRIPEDEGNSEDDEDQVKKPKENGTSPTDGVGVQRITEGRTALNGTWSSSSRGGALPFRICIVDTSGEACGRCGKICNGCPIEPSSAPLVFDPTKSFGLAIDWEPMVYDEYIDHDGALSVRLSKSVLEARKEYKDKDTMPLTDCLKLFTSTERLGPNDPWYCPDCKEQRRAWKKFDLWKLPDVLVIHLKRFQFTRFQKTKLDFFIDFPLQDLDLDSYVLNPEEKGAKYELFAVSNHMGGLQGGHYTAYAKNRLTDKWYSFNDTNVVPVKDPKNVRTPTAYVLFYQRKKDPSAPIGQPNEAKEPKDEETPSKSKSKSKKSSTKTDAPSEAESIVV